MKKIIITWLLLAVVSFLALLGQNLAPPILGFVPSGVASSAVTVFMNTAAIWPAFGVHPTSARTLNEFRIFVSSTSGTVTTGFTADVYNSDASGNPSSSFAGPITVSSSLAGGAGWYEFTGINASLSANTQYWVVLKNTTGTPGTNNMTVRHGAAGTAAFGLGTNTRNGYGRVQTADSGSTWTASSVQNMVGPRYRFADGYEGLPTSQMTQTSTTNGVYSTREAGVKITIPSGYPTLNVNCLSFFVIVAGTPTGSLRFRLYSGASTTAGTPVDTESLALAKISSSAYTRLCFGSNQALTAGNTYRLMMGETTQSDANSNRYDSIAFTIDNTAASKALTPFGATTFAYTTDGATFTDTDTAMMAFGLNLDPVTPYTVSGGSTFVPPIISIH